MLPLAECQTRPIRLLWPGRRWPHRLAQGKPAGRHEGEAWGAGQVHLGGGMLPWSSSQIQTWGGQ